MLVGIHKDPDFGFPKELTRYEAILAHNGISQLRLDASNADFWEETAKVDLFIFHWYYTSKQHQMAPTIIGIVEKVMGIPCYPNMSTCWHYDDKIRDYYLLRQYGFPTVETWVFWDEDEALAWAGKTEFPVVFKLKGGASSENVVLVTNEVYARQLIQKMFGGGIGFGNIPGISNVKWKDLTFNKAIRRLAKPLFVSLHLKKASPFLQLQKDYVLFQPFLPDNKWDTRITVIGKRAFGFRRYVRKNDFRASGSGKIDYNPESIDQRCLTIAFDVSRQLGFQSMAYDFILDKKGQPRICEISYTFVDRFTWSCPGYWDDRLQWQEGHYWPQYCVLADLLKIPDLKQPEMLP